jgi:hypothetical protein
MLRVIALLGSVDAGQRFCERTTIGCRCDLKPPMLMRAIRKKDQPCIVYRYAETGRPYLIVHKGV